MKQIEAVINHLKLQEVRDALEDMGVDDFMESAVKCHTHANRQTMSFRGATFVANIVEKVKLEIIAADDAVGKIIETIGCGDDCRIAIRPYPEVI